MNRVAIHKKVKDKPKETTETKPEAKVETNVDIQIIDVDFPKEKFISLKRVIKHLWDRHYRINYHDPYNQNWIEKSFHVDINAEGKVVVLQADMPLKQLLRKD